MALITLGFNPSHAARLFPKRPCLDPFTGKLRVPPASSPAANLLRHLLENGDVDRSFSNTDLAGYPLEVFNRSVLDPWMEFAHGGDFEPALNTLLEYGFDATTADVPTYASSRQLIEHFPEAKVILSLHPNGGKGWVESMMNICWRCSKGWDGWMAAYGAQFSKCVRDMIQWGDDINETEYEGCINEYEEENEKIKQMVPPERLLVFSPSDGWGPLCKFLEVPEPAKPFPHTSWYGARRRRARDPRRKRKKQQGAAAAEHRPVKGGKRT